jgi:hypothetical protein
VGQLCFSFRDIDELPKKVSMREAPLGVFIVLTSLLTAVKEAVNGNDDGSRNTGPEPGTI